MVTSYCTAADVATVCNIMSGTGSARAVFGSDPPIPTQAEVEALIEEAEESIELEIKQAFGTRYITITDEYKDFFPDWLENSLHLKKCNVATFDSEEGDKLEVWNGSSWEDWLSTKTEGRNQDYFVDYRLGKIFFIRSIPYYRRQAVRVTYRCNSGSTVPKPIKIATALMVGIMLTNSEHSSVLFPEGEAENNPMESRMSRWQRRINNILKRYEIREFNPTESFIPVY